MGKNEQNKLKIIVLAGFALLSVVWALVPEKIVFTSTPVCLHYKWFGIQCPFCGLSRAGYCLLHFEFVNAWNYNPLIFFIGWLYAMEWLTMLNTPAILKIRKVSWWLGLVLVIVIYATRIF